MQDQLYERDWRFIVDTLYQLALAETVDQMLNIGLSCIDALIAADQTMITYNKSGAWRSADDINYKYVGVPAKYMDVFLEGDYIEDPYFKYWFLFEQTTAFRDTDIMGEEYRMSTKTYKDIYVKQGFHYALRAFLTYKGKFIGMLNCFNSKEKGDFSNRDLFILDTLSPHFAIKLGRLLNPNTSFTASSLPSDLTQKYGLTARENEIIVEILNGSSDEEIAENLCISQATVRKHIYNIYRKTDTNRRAQLFTIFALGNEAHD